MAKNRIIAGVDLGSSKITTVIAQEETGSGVMEPAINIIGVASVTSNGIKKGQIVNIEEAVGAVIASVDGAERMAGTHLEKAYVAIGGASVFSQNSHGVVAVSDSSGEIGVSDVDRVIEAASAISLPVSREVIHVLPREFIVDGESGVKDPVGMSGVRLEVETHIVSSSSASIKNIRKAIGEVGIDIEGLVFSGLASAEAVATATERELGCVVVDIGGGVTTVAAYIDGALAYSGAIPVGAKNVTNDLAIGLRVSLETAEKVKLHLSALKSDVDDLDLTKSGITEISKVSKKTLVEGIIRPRLNEIFTMVRLDLEKAQLASRIPSGVILTGGGANTIGVIDSAKRMLSLPTRIGKPKGVGGLIDDVVDTPFATVVGLLLYGANQQASETSNAGSFMKKIKLPSKGMAGKILTAIRDLLP